MPKYQVTRKRMLTQHAVVEVELEEGISPIAHVEALDAAGLSWSNVSESALSIDVTPIAKETSNGAA